MQRYDFSDFFPLFRTADALAVGLALLLGCTSATALAQAYRWVDKDGRVHYTDTHADAF